MNKASVTNSRGTVDLETRAANLANSPGRRPDAGLAAKAAKIVREAYQRGRYETALALAEAYQLFLRDDELDGLRDALTDELPPEYVAPEPEESETP